MSQMFEKKVRNLRGKKSENLSRAPDLNKFLTYGPNPLPYIYSAFFPLVSEYKRSESQNAAGKHLKLE